MLKAQTFSSGSKSGFLSFLRLDLGLVHHLVLLYRPTMAGATTAVTCEISFRLPFGSVYTGQATVTFPDFRSTTESKLINAWPSFLRDHARRIVNLSCVLTTAERFFIGTELDRLPKNGKGNIPSSVASLPSSVTALRSSFTPSISTMSEQSAPGAAKTTSDAPVQVLTAPHASGGTTSHSFPVRHDSSPPYSALPNELFSFFWNRGRKFCLTDSSYAHVLCFHWSSP
jgi:hypothetical protein